MKQQQTDGPTTTRAIDSVIDYDSYCNRAHRLRSETLASGIRRLIQRTHIRSTPQQRESHFPHRLRFS